MEKKSSILFFAEELGTDACSLTLLSFHNLATALREMKRDKSVRDLKKKIAFASMQQTQVVVGDW